MEHLSRAIEADDQFVLAQYAPRHGASGASGNRWKASAQFRASSQLDPDLPDAVQGPGRPVPDRAAPPLRPGRRKRTARPSISVPFYAEAYVGLGDAKAAKGDVDGAISALSEGPRPQPALRKGLREPGQDLLLGEEPLLRVGAGLQEGGGPRSGQYSKRAWGSPRCTRTRASTRKPSASTKKVVELDSQNTGALYNLALVYEKVDPKESISLWERYIQLAGSQPTEKDWVDVGQAPPAQAEEPVREGQVGSRFPAGSSSLGLLKPWTTWSSTTMTGMDICPVSLISFSRDSASASTLMSSNATP